MPKVSVVIPAYNCERFIAAAVNSVLGQSYKDYELIVVNDGSTDSTENALSGFRSRITYISQKNGGPANARNAGVLAAEGEYVAFLDQDDAWLPDKLGMQVDLFEKKGSLGLVYADEYMLKDGSFNDYGPGNLRTFQFRPPHRGKVFKYLFAQNFIPTSSVMARKECFSKVGLFNSALVPIEDYDRWLRIAAFYEVDFIDRPLVRYRDHAATFRKDDVRTFTNIVNTLKGVIADYPDLNGLIDRRGRGELSRFHVILGRRHLRRNDPGKARENFKSALKVSGFPSFILYVFVSPAYAHLRGIFIKLASRVRLRIRHIRRKVNT
ncbi:MAG: glycosyltransferase [Candidatus Omnitrophica bacterium]|nr:glycosyltransferase [Candidatus Omnitrophota bacterium]MDD5545972.1 glycosyltransferase [Candidatus Omnitrophota bacterium]